jgi:hypothetical protein
LEKAKFMTDLSLLPSDRGGTQYTFLDAIYHNCAIILNRQCIEYVDPKYRDFKEGENCYAGSNSELKHLLDNIRVRILIKQRLFKMQGNYWIEAYQ